MAVQLVLIKSDEPACLRWPERLYQSLRDPGGWSSPNLLGRNSTLAER
ncbi:hypothetical protein [Mesorhizobium sp. WSM3876]|nr:hypothetical protein [Mesorhizobium sp. WSM3876]